VVELALEDDRRWELLVEVANGLVWVVVGPM
jgi:hypothetical protein